MRGLEPRGKNHSTERDCPKVENASSVPSGTTVSANGDGCLGLVKDQPAGGCFHCDMGFPMSESGTEHFWCDQTGTRDFSAPCSNLTTL